MINLGARASWRRGIRTRSACAKVTVCGPPTLIPRGMEALCEVRYDLSDLKEADVVYALRMQHERMNDSSRPCASTPPLPDQRPPARRPPGAHAPRPGQPRRRALRRGDRLAAGVIGQQVEAGVVVRMAVLYELLAGRAAPRPRRRAGRSRPDLRRLPRCASSCTAIAARRRPDQRRPRARSAHRHRRAARRPRPRRRDRRDRRARTLDAPTAPRCSTAPAAICSRLRRPARAPAHARARSTRRTSTRARAPRRPAASSPIVAMPNTDPTVDSAPVLRSLREAARREARIPVGFLATVTRRPGRRVADRDGRAARRRRARLHRRRQAGPPRRHAAQGAAVPAACAAA